jgi:hypothetical protein
MLAYVFWHWRRPDVDASTYARRIADFHEALRRSAPEGFVASCAFRSAPAPWAGGEESYEDWYVTHASYALDALEGAAVSGDCQAPHEAAARSAAGGTAGLYKLRLGGHDLRVAEWSLWFANPAGMPYDRLDALLEPHALAPGSGLWGRQMTHGPTPEFCLVAPARPALPPEIAGLERPIERIWPTALEGFPQESLTL